MFARVKPMLVKEFIQILRDPRMKAIVFVAPLFQLMVFGFAVTTDVRHVPTAVCDQDNTAASREFVARMVRSGYFDVVESFSREERIHYLMDRGEASLVLRINRGFENDLRAGRTARVQVLLDGTDSNSAGIVLNYTAEIAGAFSQAVRTRWLAARRAAGTAGVDLRSRAWFNGNLESRNFYVPGVIALIVTLITLLLTSMAVVREKEVGTIEQIMVTPITPLEFIIGKTVPFVLIAFIDVLLVTVAGVWVFDVPIRGSLGLLLVATGVFLMTTLGVGLFVSTISATQQQAMMTAFFFFFPAILLSGFMFPIANMPEVIQWLTYINPLRYFLVIIRGIFLKGVGWEVLWPQIGALGLMGVIVLGLAASRFKKSVA